MCHLGGSAGMPPRKCLDSRSSEIDSDVIRSNQRDKILFFNSCSLHREWQLAKNYLLTVKLYLCLNVSLISCAGMTAHCSRL